MQRTALVALGALVLGGVIGLLIWTRSNESSTRPTPASPSPASPSPQSRTTTPAPGLDPSTPSVPPTTAGRRRLFPESYGQKPPPRRLARPAKPEIERAKQIAIRKRALEHLDSRIAALGELITAAEKNGDSQRVTMLRARRERMRKHREARARELTGLEK